MSANAMALPGNRAAATSLAQASRYTMVSGARYTLVEHGEGEAGRELTEAFIGERFAEYYGASVRHYMPRLFTVRDEWARVCGAFGLRSAANELFLENYLELPIEQEIARRTGCRVERRQIVEVGHFAGLAPGAVRAMISLLTVRLHHEGFRWVAFTGTVSLRNAFHRMGLAPLDIRAADVSCLPETSRAAWGSYYEHGPRVLVGNIGEGFAALSRAQSRSAA